MFSAVVVFGFFERLFICDRGHIPDRSLGGHERSLNQE